MRLLQSRRDFRKGAAAVGVAAAAPWITTRPGWAQTGPIKIGILEPQSGPVKWWRVKLGTYFLNDPTNLQAVGKAAVGHVTADAYLMT
jgi:hypothetical protein